MFKEIKNDGEFYLLDNSHITNKKVDLDKIGRFCRKFIPEITIHKLGHEDLPSEFFIASREIAFFVESLDKKLKKTVAYKMINSIYKDCGIITGLKKQIMTFLLYDYYFYLIARHIVNKKKSTIFIVPKYYDYFDIFKNRNFMLIPDKIKLLYRVIDVHRNLSNIYRYIEQSISNLVNVQFCLPKPLHYKYSCQIAWNRTQIKEQESVLTLEGSKKVNMKYRWNNFFLEDNDEFAPTKILYCFLNWHFTPERTRRIEKFIKDKKGSYCHIYKLKSNLMFLRSVFFKLYNLRGLYYMFRNVFSSNGNWILGNIINQFLHFFTIWEIFCTYYRTKVMMSFDDQSLSHIVRTIVFNKYGLKNAGIHHSSSNGLYGASNIAFIYFNLHFRYGQMQKKIFSPFWDDLPEKLVGVFRGDLIYESSLNKENRAAFMKKYDNKKVVLFYPVGTSLINIKKRVYEYLEVAAKLVLNRKDVEVILLIRPSSFWYDQQCALIMEKALKTGRISVDYEDFDTWDKIAYCDLVISVPSSVVQESIFAGKKTLIYDPKGLDTLYSFYEMNPILVTVNGKELYNRALKFLDSENMIDNIDYLQNQVGVGFDGKIIQRIRDSLTEMAKMG